MICLSTEFKKVMNNKEIEDTLLIPILNWISGSEQNIKLCQTINKRLFSVDNHILSHQLILGNTLHRFIRYPKSFKPDDKLDFFYIDLCKYLGWTKRELWKNSKVINMSYLTPVIARKYAYNNKERKLLSLEKIKC